MQVDKQVYLPLTIHSLAIDACRIRKTQIQDLGSTNHLAATSFLSKCFLHTLGNEAGRAVGLCGRGMDSRNRAKTAIYQLVRANSRLCTVRHQGDS